MKLIFLISGKMRSGKNTFADILKEKYISYGKKVYCDFFAKGVKDGCKKDFNKLQMLLNSYKTFLTSSILYLKNNNKNYLSSYGITFNPIEKDITKILNQINKLEIKDENWYEEKTELTRTLLQLYGTNIFRDRISENYWVDQLKTRILENDFDVCLVTDVRFPSEIDNLKLSEEYKVIPIRVERKLESFGQEHKSEIALDDYDFQYIIDNNGSIDDLKYGADNIIKIIKEENDNANV